MKKAVIMATLLMAFMLMVPIYAEIPPPPPPLTQFIMAGRVETYGGEMAHGWLWSCGVDELEWAMAHAFFAPGNWTYMPGNWTWKPMFKENFTWTYTFYTARLVNASRVELNHTKDTEFYDLYILGRWDVYNITFTYVCNFTLPRWNVTWTREQLVDDTPGELRVTGNWTNFAVEIFDPKVKLISGKVIFHRVRPIPPPPILPPPIPIGDTWGPDRKPDSNVDIFDLVHAAKAYGSTPGMQMYDFTIDFNFDTSPGIDIYDLSTIAASLGETY